jgi:tetratricopeptide (TPR) repeat protein
VVAPALLFPDREGRITSEQFHQIIVDNAGKYFEEVWIQRPLKFLAGNTPLNAAGHPVLRKKVLGVVRFMEDCARAGILSGYDFGRVRHKLGLDQAAPQQAPTAGTEPAGVDPSGMSTQELAGLAAEGLSDEQLEKAFQAARKHDADEVAAKFGTALTARPVAAGVTADRFPLFSFLVQRSMGEGNTDAALDLVNEGQKQDCEHNEGRRRNDYELRRAEVHVKRREVEQATDVFTRLIERSPENLRYRGKAAEGMLSLRQPDRALQFAEQGVAEARRQNDRDSEQYLTELLDAARRQSK